MFTVHILLTCILHCDAGPGCNQKCLPVQYGQFLSTDIIFTHVRFSSGTPQLYFEKACLEEFLCFLQLSDRAYVSEARRKSGKSTNVTNLRSRVGQSTPIYQCAFDFSDEFLVKIPTVGSQNLVKSDQMSPTQSMDKNYLIDFQRVITDEKGAHIINNPPDPHKVRCSIN